MQKMVTIPYAVEGTDGTDGTDPDADDVTTAFIG